MSFQRTRTRRHGSSKPIAVFASLVIAHLIFTTAAVAMGPFNGYSGVWGGSGVVTYASGTNERLRCRVQYFRKDEDNLQQALRCASDSYNFQINALFKHTDGVIRGRWEELVLEISGTLSGTAAAGRIDGTLHGLGFTADLIVTTTGNRQVVKIVTPDQEIRQVDIEVRRAGG